MNAMTRPLFSAVLALLLGLLMPTQARADFFADIVNAAAKAGGYPEALPEPTALIALIGVAQDCVGDTSEDGIKACVEKAAAHPTTGPLLAGSVDEIRFGLDVYFDIRSGDYLGLVAKLGQTAGCAAALVLTGVPVCALAELIYGVATAVADVAAELYQLMSEAGAHAKVTGADYYDLYWWPKIPVAVQINRFQGAQAWEALVGPMYTGCYRYFRDIDDMSESNANQTCSSIQSQFGNEVAAEVAKVVEQGRQAIGGAWDIKAAGWRVDWRDKCITSFGVIDAEALEENCQANVDAALALGRSTAIGKIESCTNENSLSYDLPQCVALGLEAAKNPLAAAIKPVVEAEKAKAGSIAAWQKAIAEVEYQKKKFKEDLGPWIKRCPQTFAVECTDALRTAWKQCAYNIEHLPQKDIGPSFEDVQKTEQACRAGYDKLVTDYGLKAFAAPQKFTKTFDPSVRDPTQLARAQQARDDSGCTLAKVTPTPAQPTDVDVFHLKCATPASYSSCVHSLGGDLRPSMAQCTPAVGVAPTPFVNSPCCEAPRRGLVVPLQGGRPAPTAPAQRLEPPVVRKP